MDTPAWSARVAASSTGGVDVLAGRERWHITAPVSFDTARTHGATAVESLLGAVGGDLVSGFLDLAQRRRLPVDEAEAVVRAGLEHPLAYLAVVGETGTPALDRVMADVYVSSPAEEQDVRAVWEDALARSPLANTIRLSPGLDVRLTVTA